jgi:hypothetical protein
MLYPHVNSRGVLTLFSSALIAGGFGLFVLRTPFWWFGATVISAGLVLGWHLWRDRIGEVRDILAPPRKIGPFFLSPEVLIREVVIVAIIAGVCAYMMGRVGLGDRPVSHDHTVHFVNAWRMHVKLLPRGHLLGWSHDWFAGYPLGYLYPIGAELWVNAVWLLSLGVLSLSQAYAFAFWLFFFLFAYAVYRFGKTAAGPGVGLLAALLALTDPGDFRFGGWFYTVYYGVWPQSLSLAFSLLALCHLPALVERNQWRPVAGFALWMGLALITHPTPLIFIPVIWLATAVAAAITRRDNLIAAMARLVLASAFALLIASVWLVPFFGTSKEIFPMGAWWDTTYEMGKQLLELRLFPGTLGYVFAFGALALLPVFRSGSFSLVFVGLIAIAIPGLFSSSVIDALHLPNISNSFYRVQYARMVTMVKPFWFILTGYLVVSIARSAKRAEKAPSRSESGPRSPQPPAQLARPALLALLVGFLILPVLLSGAQAFFTRYVDRSVQVESERPDRDQRRQLLFWLNHNLPKGGFYRIGIISGDDHSLLDLATDLDRPTYKRGFTPCSNFIYKVKSDEPAIFEAVNLRFAISKNDLSTEYFKLLKQFGEIRVFEYKKWNPHPYKIINGSGRISFERFSSEEIAFRASPGSKGVLRLNVSFFSRWKAYRDDQPIPIGKISLKEEPETTGFMTVPLAPGHYRFIFSKTLTDRLAAPLSLIGLALVITLALADRRPRQFGWLTRALQQPLDFLESPFLRANRNRGAVLLVVVAGLLIAGGCLLAVWQPPLAVQEQGIPAIKKVSFDFLENLYRANVNIEYPDSNRACQKQRDLFMCPDKEGNIGLDNYVASEPIDIKGYKMYRCIRSRPVDRGILSVSYPRVPAGEALVGYYGISQSGRLLNLFRPTSFTITVAGNTVFSGATDEDSRLYWYNIPIRPRDVKPYRVSVSFSVRAEDVFQRHLCFYAQMVDFK